jgi:hypothetical protein
VLSVHWAVAELLHPSRKELPYLTGAAKEQNQKSTVGSTLKKLFETNDDLCRYE